MYELQVFDSTGETRFRFRDIVHVEACYHSLIFALDIDEIVLWNMGRPGSDDDAYIEKEWKL